MRSKLLRALAHIKAARFHLHEASRILRAGYMLQESDAAVPALSQVNAWDDMVKMAYANEVVRVLEPAKTP